jgi:hypothetical protein
MTIERFTTSDFIFSPTRQIDSDKDLRQMCHQYPSRIVSPK